MSSRKKRKLPQFDVAESESEILYKKIEYAMNLRYRHFGSELAAACVKFYKENDQFDSQRIKEDINGCNYRYKHGISCALIEHISCNSRWSKLLSTTRRKQRFANRLKSALRREIQNRIHKSSEAAEAAPINAPPDNTKERIKQRLLIFGCDKAL